MGQRLNLEIVEGEKTLANAYYHWGGYTESALEIAQAAVESLKKSEPEDSALENAVAALLDTGAGIGDLEVAKLKELTPGLAWGTTKELNRNACVSLGAHLD